CCEERPLEKEFATGCSHWLSASGRLEATALRALTRKLQSTGLHPSWRPAGLRTAVVGSAPMVVTPNPRIRAKSGARNSPGPGVSVRRTNEVPGRKLPCAIRKLHPFRPLECSVGRGADRAN